VETVAVRELRSQEAQHDSGAVVYSAGRFGVGVKYLGHTVTLDVDRGVPTDRFYLRPNMTWDDGTPMTREALDQIMEAVAEVERFWGKQAEFKHTG
jgi:hypothetical protein